MHLLWQRIINAIHLLILQFEKYVDISPTSQWLTLTPLEWLLSKGTKGYIFKQKHLADFTESDPQLEVNYFLENVYEHLLFTKLNAHDITFVIPCNDTALYFCGSK